MKCLQHKYPDISEEEVGEIWKLYEHKTSEVIFELEKIRNSYSSSGDRWKVIAYSKAIIAIRKLEVPLASGEQTRMLDGIGNISLKK